MNIEQRKYRGDPQVLTRLRLDGGWTIEGFCDHCRAQKSPINISTLKKLFRGEPVFLSTIGIVAKIFGITKHLELLHPDELAALNAKPASLISLTRVQEWEREEYLSDWERTANGLQYCIARFHHCFLKTRFARGKCYWLRSPMMKERDRVEEMLCRHAEVCSRFRDHPNIAKNITAVPVENGDWWVLDEWEEGRTLTEHLTEGALSATDLKSVMTGIAEGLRALHKENIIRRELSPRFVILRQSNLQPILTDFELAKLLGGKTVAPKEGWQDDAYRAVEVTEETPIDERADVYSWGRVFVEAAAGELPAKGKEGALVKTLKIPEAMKQIVLNCVARPRSDRPKRMDEVLNTLKRWRV